MLAHLRALAVFAKTVEHGSFRAAAEELHVSPSVVSHHIAQLEDQLGVALLYRSTRKLSLTHDGERLIGPARQMVTAAETGIDAVLDNASRLSGELRVTVPAVLAQSQITERVATFLSEHPGVNIRMDYSDEPRNVVSDGIDVAIRMGWLRDSTLKVRKLYDVERVLLSSRSYMQGRPTPKTPYDLEKLDWLELASVPLKPVFRRKSQRKITLRPNARLTSNSAFAAYQLAASGAGLVILPKSLALSDINNGNMQIILPDWQLDSIAVYAMRPSSAPREGLTARFVDHISA